MDEKRKSITDLRTYSRDRHKSIVEALKTGMSRKGAAAIGGITPVTFRSWLAKAQEPDAPVELVQFAADVEHAEASIERDYCESVSKAARSDWRAASWWLERRRAAFRETKNLNVETAVNKILDAVESVCGRAAAERILAIVSEDGGEGEAGEI